MKHVLLSLLCFTFISGATYASGEFWDRMRTPTGTLSSDTRIDSIIQSDLFLIADNLSIANETIMATVDHRPYMNVFKSYETNILHSFGPRLTQSEKRTLAKLSMDQYLISKLDPETELLSRTVDVYRKSNRHSETAILHHHKTPFGIMKTRVRFIFNGNAMIRQEVFVPPDDLKDATVKGYFDNLYFNAGFIETDKKIHDVWNTYISPYRIFSANVPPLIKPYRQQEVSITQSDNASVGRYTIYDPVRRQKLHYHLYEYIYDRDLTFEMVEAIIKKRHISYYGREPSLIQLKKGIQDETPYIWTNFTVQSSDMAPNASQVVLRVFFEGNVVFVQEIIGSDLMLDTQLAQTLIAHTKFHPDQYTPPSK